MDREDDYTQELYQLIQEYFSSKFDEIIAKQYEREPNFLKSIGFASGLKLKEDKQSIGALFGYNSTKSDFRPVDEDNVIIEVKRIGLLTKEKNQDKKRDNESDVKNGLAQIIEQAIFKKAEIAILVIIDAGNASGDPLNETENKYIGMFQANPFNIQLTVIRIRILIESKSFIFELVQPNNIK